MQNAESRISTLAARLEAVEAGTGMCAIIIASCAHELHELKMMQLIRPINWPCNKQHHGPMNGPLSSSPASHTYRTGCHCHSVRATRKHAPDHTPCLLPLLPASGRWAVSSDVVDVARAVEGKADKVQLRLRAS